MKILRLASLLGMLIGLSVGCGQKAVVDDQPAGKKEETRKETTPVNPNTPEVAVISTSAGDMVIEFWPEVAPNTVSNFIKLAKSGFYDGTCFHRVIKGFMIQGGDPLTKDEARKADWGTGDPGYKIKAEFNKNSHVRGVISMARSQSPDSAGSQFFICHGAPRFLDKQYTAFGKVIKGDDVLEKIGTTKTHPQDRPDKRMGVESIKIVPADSVK